MARERSWQGDQDTSDRKIEPDDRLRFDSSSSARLAQSVRRLACAVWYSSVTNSPTPFHRVQPVQLRLWPCVEPFHHLAAQPADGKLAANLSRLRKRGIAPQQVVDRLPGPPAKDRQQRVEGEDFRFRSVKQLKALVSARERMVAELHAGLDPNEREFLLSLARNEPNWALLGIEHLEQLPGVRWKLVNLEQLARANPRKLKAQAQELETLLGKRA